MTSHDDLVVHLVLADICGMLLSLSTDNIVEAICNMAGSTTPTVCANVLWMLRGNINYSWVDNRGLVKAAVSTLLGHY
jgi:hypothetical protein